MFIPDLLQRAAWRWPDRVAVVDDSVSLTFRQLRDEVFRFANGLSGLGLDPGDRVLDLQANSASYLLSDLAIPSAGLVRVALNSRLSVANLVHIAQDSGAKALVHGPGHEELAAELVDRLPGLDVVVRVAGGPGTDLQAVLRDARATRPPHRGQPSDVISLNYSSGTTGLPKGCMRTARNRYASTQDILLSLFEQGFGASDVHLHAGPLTHASGLIVLPAIAVGATQRIMRKYDAEETFSQLKSGDATTTVLVPTMLERVLAVADAAGDRPAFDSLNAVIYAGAPMSPDRVRVARDLFHGNILQFYGLVEAIPPITVLDREAHARDALLGSAGRPALGVQVDIVDDAGQSVPVGEIGEITVAGDHVMGGYWGSRGSDGKTLRKGTLRTGDMGHIDDDGYLFIVDRRGDMIITGGYNVYPREVEDVIRRDAAVEDVAVVGIADPDWGQAVTAFVVPRTGASLGVERIQALCAEHLASFKKPKSIRFVDEIPKTAIGKVDRRALQANPVS